MGGSPEVQDAWFMALVLQIFYNAGAVNEHVRICVSYSAIPTMSLSRTCIGCSGSPWARLSMYRSTNTVLGMLTSLIPGDFIYGNVSAATKYVVIEVLAKHINHR